VDAAIRPRHYETTTGGTSGRQLKILLPDDSQSVETAFMHRQWARVGYAPESLKATFRGVARALLPGGLFVFDVNTEATFRRVHGRSSKGRSTSTASAPQYRCAGRQPRGEWACCSSLGV
jgi:hypothetical protein